MIQALFFVYLLFSICIFFICLAGNPGTSSNESVQTLNNILKADGWKLLVTLGLRQELKGINGGKLDVSDLLNTGPDDIIVTPANYTDKLLKSSITLNCVYSQSVKAITDFVINIIARYCMRLDSDEQKLDCMERFWQSMNLDKSLFASMLEILYFFYKASDTMCPRKVIDALEYLIPFYDRQKYNKSNYLDNNGTVKIDDFKRDSHVLLDKINCANKLLRNFIKVRCLRVCQSENEQSDIIREVEAILSNHPPEQALNLMFNHYNDCLTQSEEKFLFNLGFDIE